MFFSELNEILRQAEFVQSFCQNKLCSGTPGLSIIIMKDLLKKHKGEGLALRVQI